jgi:hypothetical protein
MKDPKKCSLTDCNNPIGPNALEFTHKGEPAGAICDQCVQSAQTLRILFKKNDRGLFEPEELVVIN